MSRTRGVDNGNREAHDGSEPQADPVASGHLAEWLKECLGSSTTVLGTQRIDGGMVGDVTRLTISDVKENIRDLVLHCPRDVYGGRDATIQALRNEVTALEFLGDCADEVSAQTPKVIAVDYEGESMQRPSLLCSWIPGEVVIVPRDVRSWAREIAQPLPSFHSLQAQETTINRDQIGSARPPRQFPTWSKEAGAWECVIGLAQEGIPDGEPVFRHGDYHPTNLVWQDGELVGVVDWSMSSIGPVGLDLAHCRINLVSMYGLEIADCFLEAYREIGRDEARDDALQARCDAIRCWSQPFLYPPWAKLGLHLSESVIQERLDAFALDIASRAR